LGIDVITVQGLLKAILLQCWGWGQGGERDKVVKDTSAPHSLSREPGDSVMRNLDFFL
jgi:hypothetical protein